VRLWIAPDFQLKRTLARGHRLIVGVACSIAFIVWTILFGILLRRWNQPEPGLGGESSRLVRPTAILAGLTGVLAIPNSTLMVLHPGMCSCCTPTAFLLIMAYAGLGLGILVTVQAINGHMQGLITATLMLMFFNWTSDFTILSAAVLLSGGMAVLLLGIIGLRRRKTADESSG
jgi:hypothetical protein